MEVLPSRGGAIIKKHRLAALAALLLILAAGYVSAETIQGTDVWEYALQTDGTVAITAYLGGEAKLTVPSQLDGHPVTAIAPHAFMERGFSKIELPDGLRCIGDSAF